MALGSASNVFHVGDWLKMPRVGAASVPAKVVNGQPFGNRPNKQFVCPSMDENLLSSLAAESNIALLFARTIPEPAEPMLVGDNIGPIIKTAKRRSKTLCAGHELGSLDFLVMAHLVSSRMVNPTNTPMQKQIPQKAIATWVEVFMGGYPTSEKTAPMQPQ